MNIKGNLHPNILGKKINDRFHPNRVMARGKLTDGEAIFGGMRVEILRRKIKDMANKLVSWDWVGMMMFVQGVVMVGCLQTPPLP